MTEQFSNLAKTILDGSISDSDTSIDVVDGSRFPSTGNFRLTIDPSGSDPEICICSARTGNTLTVTRGEEGTTASAWGDGASIIHALTKAGLEAAIDDRAVSQPYVIVRRSAAQSLVTSTETALAFDVEDADDSGFHATNSTDVVVPSGRDGLYDVSAFINYTANATGRRWTQIKLNGSSIISEIDDNLGVASNIVMSLATTLELVGGDVITLVGWQNSGGGLNTTGRLTLARRGLMSGYTYAGVQGASVTRTANQSITGGADVAVQFTAENFDSESYHDNSTNNTRLTVPTAGNYIIGYSVGRTTAGELASFIRKNGDTTKRAAIQFLSASSFHNTGTEILSLSAGDYVELMVYAAANFTVDGTSNNAARFWIARLHQSNPTITSIATTVAGLGTPTNGNIGLIRVGSSPYEFKSFIYDSTYGKWVSEPTPLIMQGNTFNDTGTSYTSQITQDSLMIGNILGYRDLYDAGARLQFRLKGLLSNSGANLTYAQLQGSEFSDGDTAATQVFTACEISNSGATGVFKVSTWTEPTGWTPADSHMRVAVQTKVAAGTGSYFQLYGEYRWVA